MTDTCAMDGLTLGLVGSQRLNFVIWGTIDDTRSVSIVCLSCCFTQSYNQITLWDDDPLFGSAYAGDASIDLTRASVCTPKSDHSLSR